MGFPFAAASLAELGVAPERGRHIGFARLQVLKAISAGEVGC